MRYIVIDERKDGMGDMFSQEFNERAAAVEEAKAQFERLTAPEKKARMIYVLESANPDEDAPNHFDGNYIWRDGE